MEYRSGLYWARPEFNLDAIQEAFSMKMVRVVCFGVFVGVLTEFSLSLINRLTLYLGEGLTLYCL